MNASSRGQQGGQSSALHAHVRGNKWLRMTKGKSSFLTKSWTNCPGWKSFSGERSRVFASSSGFSAGTVRSKGGKPSTGSPPSHPGKESLWCPPQGCSHSPSPPNQPGHLVLCRALDNTQHASLASLYTVMKHVHTGRLHFSFFLDQLATSYQKTRNSWKATAAMKINYKIS